MKTSRLVLIIAILTISIQTFSQLTYTNNGMLGIRRTPSFNLDVEGTARFSNWTDVILDWSSGDCCGTPVIYPERDWYLQLGKSRTTGRLGHIYTYDLGYANALYKISDGRFKENISKVDNSLTNLVKLNAVKYSLKDSYLGDIPEEAKLKLKKQQFGFIAQDVVKIFPEIVDLDSSGYAIDYVSLIPVIVEALKEQQTHISTLQSIVFSQEKEIIELKKEVEKLSKKDSKLKSASTSSNDLPEIAQNSNLLMQNSPNPFTVDTEIKYFISDEVSTALLIIHDMQGLEILSYNLNERGNGSKIIQASELKAGMYLYTLIADGNIIDSKRMILTSE